MCKVKWLLLTITVFFLASGCHPDRKEWDRIKHSGNVQLIEGYIGNFPESTYGDSAALKLEALIWLEAKQSDSIQDMERFLSRFPEGAHYDSALICLERNIYLNSMKSITRTGTFEAYESLMKSYPKLAELSEVNEKIGYLKASSDTLIIHGRLIDSDKQAVSNNRVLFLPLKRKGAEQYFSITIEDGKIVMPETSSDLNGEFCFRVHRSVLAANKEYAVSTSALDFIIDENKEPIFWTLKDNERIVELGDIPWE